MALKYPEEFVTYDFSDPSDSAGPELRVNLEEARKLAATPAALRDIDTRLKSAELKTLLEEADADFRARRYERALNGYRKIAKKVLALMAPDLNRRTYPGKWPSGAEMVDLMAVAAADMLSQLAPEREETTPVFLDRDIELDEFRESRLKPTIGYAIDSENEIERMIDRANAAAIQGRWREATAFYEEALGDAQNETQQAEIVLNIGALNVQSGNPDEALGMLEEAEAMFEDVGDQLGHAQAVHNAGLARLQAGQGERAVATLERARELAGEAGLFGLLQGEDENGSGHESRVPAPFGVVQSLSGPPVEFEADRHTETLGTHDLTLRLRAVQKGTALPNVKIETPVQQQQESFERVFWFPVNGEVVELTWTDADRLNPNALRDAWNGRIDREDLRDIDIDLSTPAGIIANLGHLYHLVLPIRMGDCHHHLGDYEEAETEYRRAADYELINRSLEATDLWRRLAENVVAWGDSLYRSGDTEAAFPIYERLLTSDDEIPASFLYQTESLSATGERVSEWLDAVVNGQEPPDLNPPIVQALQTVRRRWTYLNAGLDFFGGQLNTVPPFTFQYLQEIASYFARRAIQAEQRYIDYYTRFEQEEMTKQQLENAVEQSDLNVDAARQERRIAQETLEAAQASENLANTRERNARGLLNQFQDVAWELKRLSGLIARGNAFHGGDQPNLDYGEGDGWDYSNERHVVLERMTRRQTEISNQLQTRRMVNAVSEASAAVQVAEQQKEVAVAKREAARINFEIAAQRASHAREMYEAFEDQKFTPQQWLRMASLMRYLANEALDRGIEIARLMQQAYNFEQLDDRETIRDNYRIGFTDELLGGELLLSDIDSFTAYQVSHVRHKPIPVKWSISLAEEYPGQFLEFAQTGRMEFDLDFERIWLSHPGTFRHQLKEVKVEADGFLPPFGLHGRLTNSGIGRYRDGEGNTETRIQPVETMILSRYDRHRDSIILSPPAEMRTLFEGNAVASGWTLEVPPSANDVDLNLIFDIRLVMYFECLYDQDLFEQDTQPPEDVVFERTRALYLRHHLPDAYYQLREEGRAEIELTSLDFPFNQTDPVLQSLALALVPFEEDTLEGTELGVSYPGQADPIDVTVSAENVVRRSDLPVADDSSALDSYVIEIDETQIERKDSIDDLVLLLEYQFTPAE